MNANNGSTIAVIGLGYVGLPLAIALARHFPVTGFDINEDRIAELKKGLDRTHEIELSVLKATTMHFISNSAELHTHDVYIVTVPTPVTNDHLPDLEPLQKASEFVGKRLTKGAIVVYESTVYPGVTEDFCGPILEAHSGLKAGQDFYLGYSPERINPGDKLHTIDKITKVVSGQTPTVTEKLKNIYGAINNGNIFVAQNIKTAEAAKVIENAQRDINIAFINEIASIAGKLGLSIYDVLDAANTKWNFLNFKPGLVGGHCIGVDPYYLAHCARNLELNPEVILAGRGINESMSKTIANAIHQKLKQIAPNKSKANILVLGLTFKEDIPDLRNTKVIDVIKNLQQLGHNVDVHDPLAEPHQAQIHLGIDLLPNRFEASAYDCIIGAVAHQPYLKLTATDFEKLLVPKGLIADIKNMWRKTKRPEGMHYWTL
ncbi:MAG TPA: nucleotide sugar dehydrogenase [Gammaproteobacteria bacterium]|nr:nucleotide sugar dehydrogenase [Gammaproteobacteria bacterium]